MLKRTMTAVLTITLLITAGSAMAQCVIGVYADAAGTISGFEPTLFVEFDIYVVLRNEASVRGASFLLQAPPGVLDINPGSGLYGPDEQSFNLVSPGGENIGFTNCAIGFGGLPVQVARYSTLVFDAELALSGLFEVLPNIDEDLLFPIHATCNGFLIQCPNTQALEITGIIATESKSFGAVKSLY
jgi:hypothetical protein